MVAKGRAPPGRRSIGRINLGRCRNILVVKLDFIGDWVLTTPFLANLRRSAPRAKITALVLDRSYDLAAASRDVDRVISVSRAERDRVWFGGESVTALAGFLKDYAGGTFDLALVPRWDIDFNGALKLAWASGAPRVVGFSERSTANKAVLNRGDDRFYTDVILDHRPVHEVEHKLALIEAIGGRVASRAAKLDLAMGDIAEADRFIGESFGEQPFLALAPFAAGRRGYPTERLVPVVRRLMDEFGLGVLVVGTTLHAREAGAVAKRLGGVSAAGRLTLRQSAAAIGRATVLIGMDSAPAHMAAALGTPVAVLSCHPAGGSPHHFNSPARFRPWGDPSRILIIQPPEASSPCSDACESDEPHCILGISKAMLWPLLRDFAGRFAPVRADRPVADIGRLSRK
jgi:heptosyltransferase-3